MRFGCHGIHHKIAGIELGVKWEFAENNFPGNVGYIEDFNGTQDGNNLNDFYEGKTSKDG